MLLQMRKSSLYWGTKALEGNFNLRGASERICFSDVNPTGVLLLLVHSSSQFDD